LIIMAIVAGRSRFPCSGGVSRTLPHQAHLWKRLAVAALLGNAIPYLLFGIAEQQVSSSLAGAVNATTPLWTLAIALAVRAQPTLGTLRLIGLVLGFLETLTILTPWEDRITRAEA
jgi:drug/metabolite transporter (DMT)-like permease